MRLWLLEEIKDVENGLRELIRVMVERADKEKDYLMPGYTHLQVHHIITIYLIILSSPIFLSFPVT